jgi:alpha-tubulin suppressor-like RCC1 family protein
MPTKPALHLTLTILLTTMMGFGQAQDIKAISAGSDHSIILRSDGTVWTWGDNSYGQLGDGTNTPSETPLQVQNLNDVQAVVAGSFYSLALRNDGTIWAWGLNDKGQLGDGTTTNQSTPVQVRNLTGMKAIATGGFDGAYSLALKSDGTVWTWGGSQNSYDPTVLTIPQRVQSLTDVQAIAAGGTHSLALRSDGSVWAWGSGYLGDGFVTATTGQAPPQKVDVNDLTQVIAIAAGHYVSLALRSDGTVWAWGSNDHWKLGDGTTTDRGDPTQVINITNVQAIATSGSGHSLALLNDGTVWQWGGNEFSQLLNDIRDRNAPEQVPDLTDIQAIAVGFHSMALKSDGAVLVWGPSTWNAVDQAATNPDTTLREITIPFSDAPFISGRSGTESASSVDATIEPGERWQSINDPGGASLWWTWEAPANGQVIFDTNGSDFDTILGLYSGPSITQLEMLAENDDADGLQSRLTATVESGRQYRVRVDGYEGATGNVKLNWTFVAQPSPATSSNARLNQSRELYYTFWRRLANPLTSPARCVQLFRMLPESVRRYGNFRFVEGSEFNYFNSPNPMFSMDQSRRYTERSLAEAGIQPVARIGAFPTTLGEIPQYSIFAGRDELSWITVLIAVDIVDSLDVRFCSGVILGRMP